MTPETALVPAPETPRLVLDSGDLPDTVAVSRPPAQVLAEAREAAAALMEVLAAKPHKVVLSGEQYIESEDWILIGRFYGVTAKTVADRYVTFFDDAVHGWEATASVTDRTGREVARATSMCLDDEKTWHKKPLFQLRSMAQTRAHSKALAQVLRFVPVLAGMGTTPADELSQGERVANPTRQYPPDPRPADGITDEDRVALFARAKDRGWTRDRFKEWLWTAHAIASTADLTRKRYDVVYADIPAAPHESTDDPGPAD